MYALGEKSQIGVWLSFLIPPQLPPYTGQSARVQVASSELGNCELGVRDEESPPTRQETLRFAQRDTETIIYRIFQFTKLQPHSKETLRDCMKISEG